MALLSERDAATWHHLAGRIASALEPRLDRRVIANRAHVRTQAWRLEPVGSALRRARSLSGELAEEGPIVLRTDVSAFYPSVPPPVLARSLRQLGVDTGDIRLAADLLDGWGSGGYPGLPIGPPGSAVLANAVLRPVDLALDRTPWLRWVDDYLIAARSEAHVHRLLERIDERLGRLGLARSSRKTHVAPRGPGLWPGPCSPGSAS
jgi:Reverse transcriptase (RNA-dependent DNA polymerase)